MSTKDVVRGRDARPEARRDVDVTAGDSVTVALADAVAAATGVDVTDLDGTLTRRSTSTRSRSCSVTPPSSRTWSGRCPSGWPATR